MNLLSIVIPCYNENEALQPFYTAMQPVMRTLKKEFATEVEMVFIDDGSKDGTLKALKELQKADERVHYISFSRNFGKEAGLYAGLEFASGDYVAVMDVDLQDPPELLPKMLKAVQNGECDCVATRRVTRKGEPAIRSWFARKFYQVINKISQTEMVDGARDYRLMSRQMVDSILEMKEYNRFSKGIFSWVGFDTQWLEYENVERVAGETKWSFWKLFLYSLDGIFAFSTMPLAISSVLGFILCVLAVILVIFYAIKTLLFGDPVAGFPTLICVILLVGGAQLFCIGILGQYLSRTYMEVKRRPIYIVKEKK